MGAKAPKATDSTSNMNDPDPKHDSNRFVLPLIMCFCVSGIDLYNVSSNEQST